MRNKYRWLLGIISISLIIGSLFAFFIFGFWVFFFMSVASTVINIYYYFKTRKPVLKKSCFSEKNRYGSKD